MVVRYPGGQFSPSGLCQSCQSCQSCQPLLQAQRKVRAKNASVRLAARVAAAAS